MGALEGLHGHVGADGGPQDEGGDRHVEIAISRLGFGDIYKQYTKYFKVLILCAFIIEARF